MTVVRDVAWDGIVSVAPGYDRLNVRSCVCEAVCRGTTVESTLIATLTSRIEGALTCSARAELPVRQNASNP